MPRLAMGLAAGADARGELIVLDGRDAIEFATAVEVEAPERSPTAACTGRSPRIIGACARTHAPRVAGSASRTESLGARHRLQLRARRP